MTSADGPVVSRKTFQREAEALASLNHPNIAAIHGLDEIDGVRELILELVDGETLADRIARGPIPVDNASGVYQLMHSSHDSLSTAILLGATTQGPPPRRRGEVATELRHP